MADYKTFNDIWDEVESVNFGYSHVYVQDGELAFERACEVSGINPVDDPDWKCGIDDFEVFADAYRDALHQIISDDDEDDDEDDGDDWDTDYRNPAYLKWQD